MANKEPQWLDTRIFTRNLPQSFNGPPTTKASADFQGIIEKLDYICNLLQCAVDQPLLQVALRDAGL